MVKLKIINDDLVSLIVPSIPSSSIIHLIQPNIWEFIIYLIICYFLHIEHIDICEETTDSHKSKQMDVETPNMQKL